MNPLYDYVFEIANRMYPTWDTDINGEQYQTDSFRGWDFVHQLEDERLEFSITKERYLENAPIIRSLRAMGISFPAQKICDYKPKTRTALLLSLSAL